MNKTKLALGTVAAGVTATGWGLYGAKATEQSKALTIEETTPMVQPMQPIVIPPQPITLTLANDGVNTKKQAEELTGLLNTRDKTIQQLKDSLQYYKLRVENFNKNFGGVISENLRMKDEIALRKQVQESQIETIKHLTEVNEDWYQNCGKNNK